MGDVTPNNFQDTPFYGAVAQQNKGTDNVVLTDGSGRALIVHGTTVASDGDSGYAIGCLYIHTDGGDGSALYVNEGTATSCDFNLITVAAA
jgi:hypothetical protein